jgi:putative transposase
MTPPKGWHSRGYLPHFDSPETVQFVTFRLADSLPRARIKALRSLPDAVLLVDQELDAGLGECWLRNDEIAALTQESLVHLPAGQCTSRSHWTIWGGRLFRSIHAQ